MNKKTIILTTKILIKTPVGYATKIEQKIRPFLLGKNKPKEFYTNETDSEIIWIVEAEANKIYKINRNISLYSNIVNGAFNNKIVQKTINKKFTDDQKQEVKDMLFNQTTVTVLDTKKLEEATAEEIIESNKSIWTKVKEKFKKD